MGRHRIRKFPPNLHGRDFVVGDIHGCFRTLNRALREIGFDPNVDRLFGVGDLVNRGPHSAQTLEWLERRFSSVTLGNHDRSVLSWFNARRGSAPPRGSEWLLDLSRGEIPRWRIAFASLPSALTIETAYGPVGIVHAEAPHPSWAESLRLLGAGTLSAVDDALLGLDASPEVTTDAALIIAVVLPSRHLRAVVFSSIVLGPVLVLDPALWWAGVLFALVLVVAVEAVLHHAREMDDVPEPALVACLVAGVVPLPVVLLYGVVRLVLGAVVRSFPARWVGR